VLGTGEAVGEVGLITGMPRMATVVAGPEGATLFALPAQVFEEMLQRSWSFARGLLGQLATRLVAAATPQP
jgi:CRP-like cAMP-binding protein